jgi:outer membrane lipoprotein LolB
MVVCLVAGCAALPGVEQDTTRSAALWSAREARLARLDTWSLSGRIGIVADEQAWSASVLWDQAPDGYHIEIVGPMGQGRATVIGDPSGVSLAADGQTYTARTPGELIRVHLGWDVPVSGLRYWLLGRPDPGPVQQRVLDDQGRLVSLDQAGWHIEFHGYQQVSAGLDLPGKLFMESSRMRVRVAIQSWHTAADQPAGGG